MGTIAQKQVNCARSMQVVVNHVYYWFKCRPSSETKNVNFDIYKWELTKAGYLKVPYMCSSDSWSVVGTGNIDQYYKFLGWTYMYIDRAVACFFFVWGPFSLGFFLKFGPPPHPHPAGYGPVHIPVKKLISFNWLTWNTICILTSCQCYNNKKPSPCSETPGHTHDSPTDKSENSPDQCLPWG